MIIDKNLVFSDSVAITATASSDAIDLGVARDLGIYGGPDLFVEVTLIGTFTTCTSINFGLYGAPDSGTGTEGTYYLLAESGAILVASLTDGKKVLRVNLPAVQAGAVAPRYLRMTYTVAGSNAAVGKVHAAIVPDRQANVAYPVGNTAFL